MFKGAEPIEWLTLLLTGADFLKDNRRRPQGSILGESGGVPAKRGFIELMERVISELGLGVRDEGLFPLKLGKLSPEDREVIDALIANHDKRTINRLRIVAINVPNPPPTKVPGKKERKDKDGKILEAGVPDKEIPSEIDNGALFLGSMASVLRGKSHEEQERILENFNLSGKPSLLATRAMEVIGKKTAKALGFPENATFEQVLERLEDLVAQIEVPDPTKPRPNDKAGRFVRFMRSITPGSYPNRK